MATYKEIFDEAMMKVGQVTPLAWLTPARGLLWISQIINKYQTQVGVKKCTDTIRLDGANSLDGQYSLTCSASPNGVSEITLAPSASANQSFTPIYRIPVDAFHQLINNWPDQLAGNPSNPWPDPYIDTSRVYCAIQNCTLYLFPFATEGIVTIRYKPSLPPYMPSDTKNWARFGANPSIAMAGTNIPEEFLPAIEGITAYVAIQIVENMPNGVRDYAMQYAKWTSLVEEGHRLLRRGNTDYLMDTKQPTSLGLF